MPPDNPSTRNSSSATRRAAALAAAVAFIAASAPPATAQQPTSLDLSGWLALARARSPVLAAAAAAVREAEAVRGIAGSARGPRFEAGGLYLRLEDPPALDLGPGGSFAPLSGGTYLARLSVAQPLYTGGRVAAALGAADRALHSAASSALNVEVDVTAAVARAYDDVLLARALDGVARHSLEVLEEAVRVAERHLHAGTAARLDVLRAETRLSSARSARRSSEAAIATSLERLASTAGVHPDSAPPVVGSLEYSETPIDSVALVDRARSARPEVRALRAAAGAERARAAGATAARRPLIGLYATALGSYPELLTGRDRWSWRLMGGVALSWPLFDSGEASARSRAARAAADRTEERAREIVDAGIASVRAAMRELSRAAEDVRAGRENLERAERMLAMARARYAEGSAIQLELLEAEADLTSVRGDWLRAIHSYRAALIDLRRAAGLPADASLSDFAARGEQGGGAS